MSSASASNVTNSLIDSKTAGNEVRSHVFAAFAAIAWYNAIELVVLCFVSFKRRHGVYFWSLLLSSASIVPHCLGYVLLFFPTGVSPYVCVTLIVFSWVIMVTGQSVVLWSRLHLVLQHQKILSGVLWMIIIDAVIFHIPTIVLLYGTVTIPGSVWSREYNVMERVQLLGFCVQEFIISAIYVWGTLQILRSRPQGRPNSILRQLLVINILILLLDVAIVAIEYVGYYAVQVMFKPVAYSIKLKLEYAILGKLVAITRREYSCQELPSSAPGIESIPSPGAQPPQTEQSPSVYRHYSPPFLEDSQTSSEGTSRKRPALAIANAQQD